jgi:hypothetical protein
MSLSSVTNRYPTWGLLFLFVFCCAYFGLGAKSINENWQAMNLADESMTWPSTTGTVISSELIIVGKYKNQTAARIKYQYKVNGQEFVSERVGFTSDGTIYTYGEGERCISKYAANRPVMVFYKSNDPREATLNKGPRKGDDSTFAFLTFFLSLVGILIIGYTGFYCWKWINGQ